MLLNKLKKFLYKINKINICVADPMNTYKAVNF